jgi:uncharacterized repeat protein (TIGR03837 family)
MRWDVFCRVVDNLGDAGVCWRLAAGLAARGHAVRLWIDDAAPLARLAPGGAPGVQVLPWTSDAQPQDVVVEAFGCDPPPNFVARMAAMARPPRWINLEYLSAEAYVERSHGLPSPQQAGPGRGLVKHFFYPGFTPATGGLLREPGLMAECAAFDRAAWLAAQGLALRPGEQVVTLFAYANPALAALLALLAQRGPTLLLLPQGPSLQQALATPLPAGVRTAALPWLPQPDFDHALWAADLCLVRGEDSFVRAQWAGVPFVWQIYAQHDGAHAAKLQAFLQRHLAAAAPGLAADVAALWRAWNGLPGGRWVWPDPVAWAGLAVQWRAGLLAQADLASQLESFAARPG